MYFRKNRNFVISAANPKPKYAATFAKTPGGTIVKSPSHMTKHAQGKPLAQAARMYEIVTLVERGICPKLCIRDTGGVASAAGRFIPNKKLLIICILRPNKPERIVKAKIAAYRYS